MQVEELLAEVSAAEERLRIDPLSIELFADGSGSVMTPELAPDGALCGAVSEYHFLSIHDLVWWLRHGRLSEEAA